MAEMWTEPGDGSSGSLAVPVPQLITRYRLAAAEWLREKEPPAFDLWYEAGRDLLLSKDTEAFVEWLCSERRYHFQTGPGGRTKGLSLALRGLVTRDGGCGMPADNPWAIPADADVAQVIRHVWAPLAGRIPGVIECLVQRVFAVALVSHADGDCLAYLHSDGRLDDTATRATATVTDLIRSSTFGADVCWGDSPQVRHSERVAAVGGPMPPAIRELSAVHGSLYFTSLDGKIDPNRMTSYGGWAAAEDAPPPKRMAERFVMFACYQDGSAGFDLHQIDDDGNPFVVCHDCDDGLSLRGLPFWQWFDEEVRFYLAAGN